MRKLIVVGGGLFGCMTAALAERRGWAVTVYDRAEREAGSNAAACLIKPSWIAGLPRNVIDVGLKVLSELYGVKELTFDLGIGRSTRVMRVDPRAVLGHQKKHANVTCVSRDGAVCTEGRTLRADAVLVAAGVWAGELVEMPSIQALTGAALHIRQRSKAHIRVWAPYKQAVWFSPRVGLTWFGDGTSILRENWTEEHAQRTIGRARGYELNGELRKIIVGRRPYIKGYKGYLKQHGPRLWVSNGGAKNGTLLAAYQAHKFLEAVR